MSRAAWVRDTLISKGVSVEHADRVMAEVRAEHLTEAGHELVRAGNRIRSKGYMDAATHYDQAASRLHAMTAAPTPPAPDTAAVECTCLGGPSLRDGATLHSGYCATVVHAAWTPQREAAIRATAAEGAGSLHSAMGATVPNEDVLGAFAELDRVRAELAKYVGAEPTIAGQGEHCPAEYGGPGYTHCELAAGHEGRHESALGNMHRATWGGAK